ncbi:hypothetical protein KAR34_04485, partial [bacterium]|nr:hypothetical protein [bacterium]
IESTRAGPKPVGATLAVAQKSAQIVGANPRIRPMVESVKSVIPSAKSAIKAARAVDKIFNPDNGKYQGPPDNLENLNPGDTYKTPNGVEIEIKEKYKTPDGEERIKGRVLPKAEKQQPQNTVGAQCIVPNNAGPELKTVGATRLSWRSLAKTGAVAQQSDNPVGAQHAVPNIVDKIATLSIIKERVIKSDTVINTGEKLSAARGNKKAQANVLLKDAQKEERKINNLGSIIQELRSSYQKAETTLAKTSPALYTAMVKVAELLDQKAVAGMFVKGTTPELLKAVANGLVKEIASIKAGVEKGEGWATGRLGEMKARLSQLKQEVDNYIKANIWEGIGPVGKLALAVTWGSEKLHEKAGQTEGWAGIGLKLIAQFNPGNMIMGSWGSLTGGEKITMGRKIASGASVVVGTAAMGFTYLNPAILGIQTGLILSQEAAYAGCIKSGMSVEKAETIKAGIGSIGFLMVMASWKSNPVKAAKQAGGLLVGIKAVGKDMLTKSYAARLGAFFMIEKAAKGTAWLINESLGGDKYTNNVIKGTIIGIGFKFGAKPAQQFVRKMIREIEVKSIALQIEKAEGYRSPTGMGAAKPGMDKRAVDRALLEEITGVKGTVVGGVKGAKVVKAKRHTVRAEAARNRAEAARNRAEAARNRAEAARNRAEVREFRAGERQAAGQLQQSAQTVRRTGSQGESLDQRIAGYSAQNEILSFTDKTLGYIGNLAKGFKPEYQKHQPESIRPKINNTIITGAARPGLISTTMSTMRNFTTPWRTGLAGATGVGLVMGIGDRINQDLHERQ